VAWAVSESTATWRAALGLVLTAEVVVGHGSRQCALGWLRAAISLMVEKLGGREKTMLALEILWVLPALGVCA